MSPLFWVGVLAATALVSALVSVALTLWAGSTFQLRSEVRQLSIDVTELFDKVEHWRGRDAVRRMRAGQEAAAAVPAALSPQEHKAQLRAKLRNLQNGGSR